MSMSKKTQQVHAVILAGDKRASIKVKGDNKAFLLLKEKPLFLHVANALQQADRVAEVYVVGPKERLQSTLDQYNEQIEAPERLHVVAQGSNVVDNLKHGFLTSLHLKHAATFDALRGGEHAETPLLVVPCDIPLLTPFEIDQFVKRSNMDRFDYAIGITSENVLSLYHPREDRPGIRMIYFHVKEDLVRHNNLHLGKPLKLAHLDYIEKMYECRYQTKVFNIVRLMLSLIKVSWRFATAIRIYIFLQLSLYYDRHGHPKLAERMRMHAPLASLPKGISKILGAKTEIIYTTLGGAAIDVDHDENLDVMEERYEDWMNTQRTLALQHARHKR